MTIPTNPPPNYKVAGHLHLGTTTTDYFVIVFNEQIVNPDGSITVNPVHEYFGYKLDGNGNLVQDLPYGQGGSILHGHLYMGQVTAGVTTQPGPNSPPVATDDAYSTDYQTPLTVDAPGVLGNDTDNDGGTLTAGNASNPAGGSVTLNGDGSFTYTPDAGATGPDTFTYTVTDDHGATDTGTVTITVGPPPPLPEADLSVDADGPTALNTSTRKVPVMGTYTFTITNNGPEAAENVTFSASTAGARVSYGAVTPTGGTCTITKGKTKTVNCTFGALAPLGQASVSIVVNAPTKPGTMTITGTASTASNDTDSTNNSDSVTTVYTRS
ncbi:MAG: Ig-like domain-containing protein, partial [Micromonosporaceae bacterium]